MAHAPRLLPDRDVTDIRAYQDSGGGRGFEVALRLEPHEVIDLVDLSGLRGRGGAGFPTGRKWRTIVDHRSTVEPTPVVVNGAEGEPGTFKDRLLMRRNPFLVLEGAVIAARAIGSTTIKVALKSSFTTEASRMGQAISEMREVGWLDGLDIEVVTGPTEYLFGEETGLLEVLEGRPPFPRVTPPWRRGLDDDDRWNSAADADMAAEGGTAAAPVLVDNVETLANLPLILGDGVESFRSIGTESSPGSVLCTVTGACNRHGVGEFAFGTPISEVIDQVGGGPRLDRRFVAVLSGVAAPPLPADRFDTPLTYEDLIEAGSGLGSASFIVIDDSVPFRQIVADVARFLAIESCGQCEPCKRDGLAIAVELRDGDPPDGAVLADRLSTVTDGARCALADQTQIAVGGLLGMVLPPEPNPAPSDEATGGSTLGETFDPATSVPATGEIDSNDLMAIVPLLDIVDDVAVLDLAHRDKGPDWTSGDITDQDPWPAARLSDQAVHMPTRT